MNLDEEIRRGYTISPKMKKVWAIQTDMVRHLLDVCKRHNLRIWADGGTLLGTVREHGYIPWDDDIDMLMLREDYDCLLSIANQEFKPPYFFQCYKTDKKYYRGHSQLRMDGTTAIGECEEFCDFHKGIAIDIFVYDALPDVLDADWDNRLRRRNKIMGALFNYMYPIPTPNPIRLLKRIYRTIYCKRKGALHLYEECENLFRHYKLDENKRIFCPMFNLDIFKTAVKQKEWYSSTIEMPFEDLIMPVPVGYDNVLTTQYGPDYMIPRKAPSMHSGFRVLDPEKPYTEYVPKLKKSFWKRWFVEKINKIKAKL